MKKIMLQEVMNCIKCFDDLPMLDNTCGNPSCIVSLCKECFVDYIKYCHKESIMVHCLDNNCKTAILLSSTESLESKYKKMYLECFEKFIKQTNEVQDDLKTIQNALYSKFLKEKREFIENNFPKSVSAIINIAYKSDLTRITKTNKLIINSVVTNTNKKCFNYMCRGIIDSDYKCFVCQVKFCKDCEKECEKDKEHKCDLAEIESLKIIDAFVKCPTCAIPVERTWGCNFMTCPYCKTNFDYTNGKKSEKGNHSEQVLVEKQKTLVNIFSNNVDEKILPILQKIDLLLPKQIKLSSAMDAKHYELYILNLYYSKMYFKCTNQLIGMNVLDFSFVENMYKLLHDARS